VSTATTNLGLTKAGPSEAYDVAVVNANLDAIDMAVGKRSGSITPVVVANTTGEVVIATLTLPANSGSAGRVWQVVAAAVASVTGTPTLTIRARIGGLAGALVGSVVVTAASGVTGKSLRAVGEAVCVTTGVSGTWLGSVHVIDELNTTLPNAADVNVITAAVTKDTTAQQDLVLTAQWSAASASDTLTAYYGYGRRVG